MRYAALLALCVLVGCASAPPNADRYGVLAQARGPEQNQSLYLDLVRKMIEKGQLYAALAHLDAQKQKYGPGPAARVLRAEVLRKLGRTNQAAAMYRSLIDDGIFPGRAHHGLGLIKVTHNLGAGIKHLQKAADLRPTDARIRNDLGYALLKAGRYGDALLNLATAYQLEGGGKLARNNYIVALLVAGKARKASHIAAETEITKKTLARLKERAARLDNQAGSITKTASVPTAPRIGVGGG